jgi:Amt family ammonium transporter
VFCLFFGFIPGWVISRVLKAFGMLRVDPRVELAGLDGEHGPKTYPGISGVEATFEAIQRKESKI